MLLARSRSVDETKALAAALAELARPGDLILLAGELGAGKTAFAQGFGAALGVAEPHHQPHLHARQPVRGPARAQPPRRVPARAARRGARHRPARDARRGRRDAHRVGRRHRPGPAGRLPEVRLDLRRRRRRPHPRRRVHRAPLVGPQPGPSLALRAWLVADLAADDPGPATGSGDQAPVVARADPRHRHRHRAGQLRHRRPRGRAGLDPVGAGQAPRRVAHAGHRVHLPAGPHRAVARSAWSPSTSAPACSPACGSAWPRPRPWPTPCGCR